MPLTLGNKQLRPMKFCKNVKILFYKLNFFFPDYLTSVYLFYRPKRVTHISLKLKRKNPIANTIYILVKNVRLHNQNCHKTLQNPRGLVHYSSRSGECSVP